MLKVERSGKFQNMMLELVKQDLPLLHRINSQIKLFQTNPDDRRVRNHLLKRKMKGKFAFSITDDIRVIYEWLGKSTVRFVAIGGHKKVYTHKNHDR